MFKPNDKLLYILFKKKQGETLSAEEEMCYQQWQQHHPRNTTPIVFHEEVKKMLEYEEEQRSSEAAFNDKFRKLLDEERAVAGTSIKKVKKGTVIRLRWVAAAVLTGISVISWYWYGHQPAVSRANAGTTATSSGPRRKPFEKELSVTMADGRRVVIDQAVQQLGTQGAFLVTYNNGVLSYKLVDIWKKNQPAIYNTVQLPAGQRLSVQLPDGSLARLDAAAKINIPLHYMDTTREVALDGEASFEVKKDLNRRFIVHAGGIDVEAVGTKFTVTHNQEGPNRIILQEGIINIRSKKVFAQVKQPQVWLASEDQFEIVTLNADTTKQLIREVAAREKGIFYFYAATLAEIVPVLERWYNLELDSRDILSLPDRFHIDAVSVSAPFEQFAKALEGSKILKVSVQGRKLRITKLK